MKRLHFPIHDTYLTARELELLRLLAHGYENKEMAARMFISIKTVEKHRMHVYEKLRVDCPIAALRVGIRSGYVSIFEWLDNEVGENVVRRGYVSGQQTKLSSLVGDAAE